jgi:hypothetical protein
MNKSRFKSLLKSCLMTQKEFADKYKIPYDSVLRMSRKTQLCAKFMENEQNKKAKVKALK